MGLKEVIGKCKSLTIFEERFVADNYYEIVFYTKDTKEWTKMLTDILGPVVKPKGKLPTQEDAELTKKYGGVRENQILFKGQVGTTLILAMFWPWQDEVRTTLKIAFEQK